MTQRSSTQTGRTIREDDKFMLRLPDGLRSKLKALALENGRSLNSELVLRLEQSVTDPAHPPTDAYALKAEAKLDQLLEMVADLRQQLAARPASIDTPEPGSD